MMVACRFVSVIFHFSNLVYNYNFNFSSRPIVEVNCAVAVSALDTYALLVFIHLKSNLRFPYSHRWEGLSAFIHRSEIGVHLQVFDTVAQCGLWGCKNSPAPFPGRMSYKKTKPGLVSVLYLGMHYTVLLFIRAPFYVSLVLVAMCSVFWLFWLSYQYLPSDWLERLLWESLFVARGLSPGSPGRRVHSYCFVVLLSICVVSCPYMI